MRRLTVQKLESAFLDFDKETIGLFTFLSINRELKKEDFIDLREALIFLRNDWREIAAFVEKILQPNDIDYVDCVIELLIADIRVGFGSAPECLRMLQAWRAKMLMQIIIDRGNEKTLCTD